MVRVDAFAVTDVVAIHTDREAAISCLREWLSPEPGAYGLVSEWDTETGEATTEYWEVSAA